MCVYDDDDGKLKLFSTVTEWIFQRNVKSGGQFCFLMCSWRKRGLVQLVGWYWRTRVSSLVSRKISFTWRGRKKVITSNSGGMKWTVMSHQWQVWTVPMLIQVQPYTWHNRNKKKWQNKYQTSQITELVTNLCVFCVYFITVFSRLSSSPNTAVCNPNQYHCFSQSIKYSVTKPTCVSGLPKIW